MTPNNQNRRRVPGGYTSRPDPGINYSFPGQTARNSPSGGSVFDTGGDVKKSAGILRGQQTTDFEIFKFGTPEEKAAALARLKSAPREAAGFGVGQSDPDFIVNRFASDIGRSITGMPAGLAALGAGVGKDVYDTRKGDWGFDRSRALGKGIYEDTKDIVKNPLERPGDAFLLGAAAFGGGAGTLARLKAASKAGKSKFGESLNYDKRFTDPESSKVDDLVTEAPDTLRKRSIPGAVGQAARSSLTRHPSEGGGLLRRPNPGRIKLADGSIKPLSNSPIAAFFQKLGAQRSVDNPERRRVSYGGRNLNEEIGHRRRFRERVERPVNEAAPKSLIELTKKKIGRDPKISMSLQAAIRASVEGNPIEVYLKPVMAQIKNPKDVKMKGKREQQRLIRDATILENARLYLSNPDSYDPKKPPTLLPGFRDIYDVNRRTIESAVRRENRFIATGDLSPEQAASRVSAPGRIARGAKFKRPNLEEAPTLFSKDTKVQLRQTGDKGKVIDIDEPRGLVTIQMQVPITKSKKVDNVEVKKITKSMRDVTLPLHAFDNLDVEPYLVGAEWFKGGKAFITFKDPSQGWSLPWTKDKSLSTPVTPESVRNTLKGVVLKEGKTPLNAVEVVAKSELESIRYQTILDAVRTVADDPTSLTPTEFAKFMAANPSVARKHYSVLYLKPEAMRSPEFREFRDRVRASYEDQSVSDSLTKLERKNMESLIDSTKKEFFPDSSVDAALAAKVKDVLYYDQRRIAPVLKSLERAEKFLGSHKLASVADTINRAAITSFLLLKPAYFFPNALGQTFLGMVHGSLAPWNLAMSTRTYQKLSHESKISIREIMQIGFIKAIDPSAGVNFSKPLYQAWSKVLDSPFRWPAFLHEAEKMGYSGTKINDLFKKSNIDDLDEIAQRSNAAMIDYARMGAKEKNTVRRIVLFYPFVKGSTMYAGKIARDNPVMTAALGTIGNLGSDFIDTLGEMPEGLEGFIPYNEDEPGRPRVGNPLAAQLFEYPVQFVRGLKTIGEGEKGGFSDLLGLLSPAISLPLEVGAGIDTLTGGESRAAREGKGVLGRLEEAGASMSPIYRVIQAQRGEIDDVGIIQRDAKDELLRYAALGGLAPQTLDKTEVKKTIRRQEVNPDPGQRSKDRDNEKFDEFDRKAHEIRDRTPHWFEEDGSLKEKFYNAFGFRTERNSRYAIARKEKGESLSEREKLDIVFEIAVDGEKISESRVDSYERRLQGKSGSDKEKFAQKIRLQIIRDYLGGELITNAGKRLNSNDMDWNLGKSAEIYFDDDELARSVFDGPPAE